MSPFARKFLLPFHLWAGLTIGLILVVMAVSGAMLVYQKPLERRFDAHRFVVTPGATRLPVSDLVTRARAAHPDVHLDSIHFSGEPTAPLIALFSDNIYVHVNPYTGAILGLRQRYGESFGWIEGLHRFLRFTPSTGEPITGYAALIFGLIILTGFVLWWPASRRALKAGLTLNRKLSGRPWSLNLHRTLGAYAGVMLLISVTTGVPLSLDWAKHLVFVVTGSKEVGAPKIAADADAADINFDAVAQSIASVMPSAQDTYIPLPKKGVVPAYTVAMDASHPNARSYMWTDTNGKILRYTPYEKASVGFRLYYWMLSLHTALVGGPVVPVMLILGALSIPVLAYTGAASYFRRKGGKSAVQATKSVSVSQPSRT